MAGGRSHTKPSLAELRRRAEEAIAAESAAHPGAWSSVEQLVHELEVHEVELDLQNDELRRTQDELARARDRYFELYDVAPVGYLTLDHDGRIVEANLTATELLGIARERLVGIPLARQMSAADADRFHLYRRQLSASRTTLVLEVSLARADKTCFPAMLTSTAVSVGETVQFRAILVDLSEKRRLELELRESLTRFREIAETIDDVFYLLDPEGRLVYLSPAIERRYRYKASEVSAESWIAAVHVADRGRVRRARRALGAGGSLDIEYRFVAADGEVRIVRERAFLSELDRRVVGILHDVTDERRIEEERRHAQRMESIGTLASGIAHDFNNLLMGISGLAEMAIRSVASGSRAAKAAARIKDAALRGSSLTRQLVELGVPRPNDARPIAIDAVLADSRQLLEVMLGEQIALQLELGAGAALVCAEPGDIRQILINLASNARDAMLTSGTFSIRTSVAADLIEIRVADSGSGMDEATRKRIFEPFFTTKDVGKGTGLGLSTVFAVCRRLGGRIEVQTEVGCGATFTVRLPAAAARTSGRPQSSPIAASGQVLLVEDEPAVREMLANYLEDLGYQVVATANADEAIAAFARAEFDSPT